MDVLAWMTDDVHAVWMVPGIGTAAEADGGCTETETGIPLLSSPVRPGTENSHPDRSARATLTPNLLSWNVIGFLTL